MGGSADSDIRVIEAPDSVAIELRGTLDVFLAQRFAEAALHCVESGLCTTLDCSALERMDASALQIVLALRNALRAKAQVLRVANVPANVAAYLELAGVRELAQV